MADLDTTIADFGKRLDAIEKRNTAQDKTLKELTAAIEAVQAQLSDNPTALDPHTIKWVHNVLNKWHGGDRPAPEPETDLVTL
jgi:uncharacterized coiled-coil protein SlyX